MSLCIYLHAVRATVVFDANITHNVTPMWREAGIYEALYKSDGKKAAEVLKVLHAGLADMQARPEEYRALDSTNGWGTYKQALLWLERLVTAFDDEPEAVIGVSA